MKKLMFFSAFLCMCMFTVSGYSQNKPTDRELFAQAYIFKPEDIKIADVAYRYNTTKPELYRIERGKKETKVTFLQPIYFDSQWLHYSKGFVMVNKKNGDEYVVRRYDGNMPMGKVQIVRGCNNKMIYITLVFPKLKRNVKTVDIIERAVEDDPCPSNNTGTPTAYKNVRIADYSSKALIKQAKMNQNRNKMKSYK